jgi:hypothetical protein
MSIEPVPFWWVAMVAAFWLYGMWPAFWPEHFRRTGVRYFRPRSLAEEVILPVGIIRLLGLTWVTVFGFVLILSVIRPFFR